MTKKQKRAAEKQKQDSVAAICRYFIGKAKIAVRTGYVSLQAAATDLYATPAVPPSPYEVKVALMDALEDCVAVFQQGITDIRKAL